MTGWTTPLRPGLPLSFDGDQFTVAEIEGSRVMLRRTGTAGAPSWRQVDLVALLSHPSTRILTAAPERQPALAATLGVLDADEDDELTARYRHVQEVRTGYRHGCAELALEGEPRPQYAPGVPMMARYQAKAAELGVGVSTVRRWVTLAQDGPAGLVAERPARVVLDRADPRWLHTARQVIARHVPRSRPVRRLILAEIEQQLADGTAPARCRCRRNRQGMSCCGNWTRGRARSPAARKASGRSRTGPRVPTDGCGRPGRASTWCWTPTGWTYSRWSR